MSETTIKEILPNKIIFDAGTQARVRTDVKTCQSYIESMKDGVEFPPLDVFSDGTSDKYVLADGFHRLQSHMSFRQNEPIKCVVHFGTVSDAQWFAITANKTHGFRRANEDKRKAVKMALLHPKGIELSNNSIAEQVGVSLDLVNRIRHNLELTKRIVKSSRRTGKDGRVIDTTNIGQNRKYPYLNEPPEPDTNIRKNADGVEVNITGFDFTARRRCDGCEMWDRATGFCDREDKVMASWTPGCCDWVRNHDDEIAEFREPAVELLKTNADKETTRTNAKKSQYVRQAHVKCKIYPLNPQLSVVEIRHLLGEKYLRELQNAITTILSDT